MPWSFQVLTPQERYAVGSTPFRVSCVHKLYKFGATLFLVLRHIIYYLAVSQISYLCIEAFRHIKASLEIAAAKKLLRSQLCVPLHLP